MHAHIQSVHRKVRYNYLLWHHNFKQTSNAHFSTTNNYLLSSQLNRNSDKDSSSLKGHIEQVCRFFFSVKVAEYDARKVTGNKYNANFVFKPGVTSHNEEIHDLEAFHL